MPNSVIKGLIKQSKKSEKDAEKAFLKAKSIYQDDTGKKESDFKDKDWKIITKITKNILGIKESVENNWINSFLESEANSKDFFENKLEEKCMQVLEVWKGLQKLKEGDKLEIQGIKDSKPYTMYVVTTIDYWNTEGSNKKIQKMEINSKPIKKEPNTLIGKIVISFESKSNPFIMYNRTHNLPLQLVDFIIIKGKTYKFNFKESIDQKEESIQESSFEQIVLEETKNNHSETPHDSITFTEADLKGKKTGMYFLEGFNHTHDFILTEKNIDKLNNQEEISTLAKGIDHSHQITISYYGVFKEATSKIPRLKEYIETSIDAMKYKDKIIANKKILKQTIEQLKKKWFQLVFDEAKKGTFISWQILNDVWNLNPQSTASYYYRLIHDLPEAKFDSKWVKPKKDEPIKGNAYKDRDIKYVDEQVTSANLNTPEPIKKAYKDPDKEKEDDEEEEVDEDVSSFSTSSFGGGSKKDDDKDKKKKDKK